MIDIINKKRLLKELMSYDFILTELNLYLNSHPNDKNALKMHCEIADKAEALRKRYTKEFGPLTAATNNTPDSWDWVCGPWPWENQEERR